MNSIQLCGVATATANAVAQVVIPGKTTIKQIQYSIAADQDTGADFLVRLEVSRASASEIAVNGAQQCLANLALGMDFTTSGAAVTVQNGVIPVSAPVIQGQILYVHAIVAGTVDCRFNFLLWY